MSDTLYVVWSDDHYHWHLESIWSNEALARAEVKRMTDMMVVIDEEDSYHVHMDNFSIRTMQLDQQDGGEGACIWSERDEEEADA